MDKLDQRYKTVQQIIDEREKREPMRHAPRVYSDNRRQTKHTRWHMEHVPYQIAVGSRREEKGK